MQSCEQAPEDIADTTILHKGCCFQRWLLRPSTLVWGPHQNPKDAHRPDQTRKPGSPSFVHAPTNTRGMPQLRGFQDSSLTQFRMAKNKGDAHTA